MLKGHLKISLYHRIELSHKSPRGGWDKTTYFKKSVLKWSDNEEALGPKFRHIHIDSSSVRLNGLFLPAPCTRNIESVQWLFVQWMNE